MAGPALCWGTVAKGGVCSTGPVFVPGLLDTAMSRSPPVSGDLQSRFGSAPAAFTLSPSLLRGRGARQLLLQALDGAPGGLTLLVQLQESPPGQALPALGLQPVVDPRQHRGGRLVRDPPGEGA